MKDHLKAIVGVTLAGTILVFLYYFYANNFGMGSEKTYSKSHSQSTTPEDRKISIKTKTITNVIVDSEQVQSPIIVLNFWASWCGPCVEEVPSLVKMIKKFKGKIHLIAVSGDDSLEDIQSFLKAFPELKDKNIDIVWDQNKEIMKTYGTSKLPESMIITPQGKLIRKVIGSINWDTPEAGDYLHSLIDIK